MIYLLKVLKLLPSNYKVNTKIHILYLTQLFRYGIIYLNLLLEVSAIFYEDNKMFKLLLTTITGTFLLTSVAVAQVQNATPKKQPNTSNSTPKSKVQNYSSIYFRNSCNHPIQVGVSFKNLSNKWQSKAWYSFAPNEGAARLNGVDTRNRYLYYYAETTDGSDLAWTGNFSSLIKDRLYELQEINTGKSITRWTQTLTCSSTASKSLNNKNEKSEILLAQSQAVKSPEANQQAPEEMPPVISTPVQVDAPKEEVQQAPTSPNALPPAKGNTDAAVEVQPSPSPTDTPSPSNTEETNPKSSTDSSTSTGTDSDPSVSPSPSDTNTPGKEAPGL